MRSRHEMLFSINFFKIMTVGKDLQTKSKLNQKQIKTEKSIPVKSMSEKSQDHPQSELPKTPCFVL